MKFSEWIKERLVESASVDLKRECHPITFTDKAGMAGIRLYWILPSRRPADPSTNDAAGRIAQNEAEQMVKTLSRVFPIEQYNYAAEHKMNTLNGIGYSSGYESFGHDGWEACVIHFNKPVVELDRIQLNHLKLTLASKGFKDMHQYPEDKANKGNSNNWN